jgi:hypothetical protein
VAGVCFCRNESWAAWWAREHPGEELTYLFDEDLRDPDRPMPVADVESEEGERPEERERVPAGVNG